jgi:MFS transporter, DHA2 family, multidrug resistance protein
MSVSDYLLPNAGFAREPDEETSGTLAPEFAQLSHNQKMAILLLAGVIAGVEVSSRASINVILPDMQGNVAGDVDQISWVLILYNMGFICSIALTPWATRFFGARRHFTLCVLLYTTGALGCFLSAHNLTTLLIARTIMGLGGGFFFVRLVITAGLFFSGQARRVALSWVYLIVFSLQIIYPTAIGAISDHVHWNYAFLLDIPSLLAAMLLLRALLPRGHVRRVAWRVEKGDFWGASFLILALVALQLCTSRGERDLWFESPVIAGSFVAALVAFALFVWWDSRAGNLSPVLNLRHVFQLAPVRNAVLAAMVVGAGLGAGLYVVPQYLRNVQDYSATQTGEFFSWFFVGFAVGALSTLLVLVPRFGVRVSSTLGMVLLVAAFALLVYCWTPTTPSWVTAVTLAFQGFAQGIATIAVANAITGQLATSDIWEGDTTYFFVRQLGNTFGLTAVTILFDRRMTLHSSRLLDVANQLDPATHATLSSYSGLIARSAGAGSDPQLGALQLFQSNVITQSRVLSYIDVSAFLALLFVVGVFGALALKPSAASQKQKIPPLHGCL